MDVLESPQQSGLVAPAPLLDFARRRIEQDPPSYGGVERREAPRHRVALAVRVVPLNAQKQPSGDEYIGVTYDVSVGGISFFHRSAIRETFLEIELETISGMTIERTVEVLRCESAGLFYLIAGRFVGKSS